MVTYAYICVGDNPSTQEAGAGGLRVLGQPRLYYKILSQKNGERDSYSS